MFFFFFWGGGDGNSEVFSSPSLVYEVPVEYSVSQIALGLHLDQKLDFSKYINEKISKAQKALPVINILPRNVFLAIYKSRV